MIYVVNNINRTKQGSNYRVNKKSYVVLSATKIELKNEPNVRPIEVVVKLNRGW